MVLCLSRGYKRSQACRTEAEYAATLKKRLVPVRMEAGFAPTGWLGAMVAGKAVFQLADPRKAADVAGLLARHIGDVAVAREQERFLHR